MEKTKRHFQPNERTYIGAMLVLIAIVILIIFYVEWREKAGQ